MRVGTLVTAALAESIATGSWLYSRSTRTP